MLYLAGVGLTTVTASLATMPFAAYHFNRIIFFGLAANLVAVPITGLWIMPWAMVAFALLPVGLEGAALVPMGLGIETVIGAAREVASWPGATATIPAMPMTALALTVLGGLWLCLWRGRWRCFGFAPAAFGLFVLGPAQPPDVLIDGDAKTMAVRGSQGEIHLSSRRRSGFQIDTWLRCAGVRASADDAKAMTCDALGCIWHSGDEIVAFVKRGDALEEDCRVATVVLSAVPIRRGCPSARLVVDRFDLWREGTHAIWLDRAEIVVRTVASERGQRPWTGPDKSPGR